MHPIISKNKFLWTKYISRIEVEVGANIAVFFSNLSPLLPISGELTIRYSWFLFGSEKERLNSVQFHLLVLEETIRTKESPTNPIIFVR